MSTNAYTFTTLVPLSPRESPPAIHTSIRRKARLLGTKSGRVRYVPLTTRMMAALKAHRHLRGYLRLLRNALNRSTFEAIGGSI